MPEIKWNGSTVETINELIVAVNKLTKDLENSEKRHGQHIKDIDRIQKRIDTTNPRP